ncbi:MAG: TatD family hydrolase [Treponema sp.]|nr:TatD family hydrolase [Treponema sp.]
MYPWLRRKPRAPDPGCFKPLPELLENPAARGGRPPPRLLTETDAPYVLRGREFSRRADLPLILNGMADLRRQAGAFSGTPEDLEKTVDANFRRAFCVPAQARV